MENYRPGFTATVERNVCTETLRQVGSAQTDLTFADGFESGNLSAWSSSVTDSGDLSVTTGAALIGSYGMAAVIDDINAIYVQDDTPSAENRYRVRFYFDPNSIPMATKTATPSCARSRRAAGS